jgi:hypothetical protein
MCLFLDRSEAAYDGASLVDDAMWDGETYFTYPEAESRVMDEWHYIQRGLFHLPFFLLYHSYVIDFLFSFLPPILL